MPRIYGGEKRNIKPAPNASSPVVCTDKEAEGGVGGGLYVSSHHIIKLGVALKLQLTIYCHVAKGVTIIMLEIWGREV
jgi:hypothetical protein